MIRYALNFQPCPFQNKIGYKDHLLFHGSCFSDHIASRLQAAYFNVASQPNGVVFNPLSLAEVFLRIFEKGDYQKTDLIQDAGYWHSKFHHGSFSETNASDVLRKINHSLHAFHAGLKTANFLFITFGSAHVYIYKKTGEIVANCHKINQTEFEKKCLSVEEILAAWLPILSGLKNINPNLNIVFTVSPVKHLKDGVLENSLSKATCLLAIHQLIQKDGRLQYFPAYELVNDDLRDYRFYDADGAHPNALAIDYVYDVFKKTAFNDASLNYLEDIEKFNTMQKHKLLKTDGEDYLKFMKKLEDLAKDLNQRYTLDL